PPAPAGAPGETAAGQVGAAPSARVPAPPPGPASGPSCRGAALLRASGRGGSGAGDRVGWGAFCWALVPVALLACGASFGGAAGIALGLAAMTATCRALLRRTERRAARMSGDRLHGRSVRRGRTAPDEPAMSGLSDGRTTVG
ncbi:hypothetical protein AAHZ94_26870, partial [Streptomyces sp. HSW2009]|uniref:hypothetical protein n=1 Tax=Streptomyces sp. HSW2009 TaxID=3142890 RepID=UPI0032EF59A3